MIDENAIINQNVSIKIIDVERPQSAFVKGWTDTGIWVQSEALPGELALLAKEQSIPGFLQKNPLVFLPLHRIEWVMVNVAMLRSTDESVRRPLTK